MMSRVGQTWEIDMKESNFDVACRDVITYLVVHDSSSEYADGVREWRCLVLETTPFEQEGELIDRPEYIAWEDHPRKYRRLG